MKLEELSLDVPRMLIPYVKVENVSVSLGHMLHQIELGLVSRM